MPWLASANTISWWRFEEDENAGAPGTDFSNPNEVPGEPSLVSSNAVLGTSAPDLFSPVVPGPGVVNTASVRSETTGGSSGIYGEAAYSSTLDVNSITVEFWIRTNENDAGFVARTSNGNAGEQGSIVDGFRIVDPNNVRVNFWTAELNVTGVSQSYASATQTTLSSGVSVKDGDWHYIAFSFDSTTGRARLVVDYDETEVFLDPGRVMFWGGSLPGAEQPVVTMGYRLDGNSGNNNGTLDEVRFTDQFEEDEDLLNPIPEPGNIISGLLISAFIGMNTLKNMRSEQCLREELVSDK